MTVETETACEVVHCPPLLHLTSTSPVASTECAVDPATVSVAVAAWYVVPLRVHVRLVGRQPANLKLPTRVLQLNVPLAGSYSFVYQNVQSSTGSTLMLL